MKCKRAAIFAHYDVNNVIQDYVVYYIKELKKVVDYLVFVSDSNIDNCELEKLQGVTDYNIIGQHKEYDFGSYKRGYYYLLEKGLLSKFEKLVLVNDSCYAPIFPFINMFEKMENRNIDFWGITADRITHFKNKLIIQSFFLVFNEKVFLSEIFDNLMDSIKKEKDKAQIVKKYEQGFTLALEKAGYTWDVYSQYSKNHWESCIIDYKEILLKEHCPTLKRNFILGKMPHLFSMQKLKKCIDCNTSYNFNLILNDYLNNKVKSSARATFEIIYKTFGRKIIRFLQKFINNKQFISQDSKNV